MNEKPRVLFITTSFPTSSNQGSGIFVFRLINQLSNHVRASVLTPDTTAENTFNAGSLDVIPARYAPRRYQTLAHSPGGIPETVRRHPLNYASLVSLLISLFLNTLKHGRRAQLIHSNWSIGGLIGGAAALFIRRPTVVTLRGADLNRAKDRWLDRATLGIALRLNDRVVCVSQSQHTWLLDNFPAARGKTLHIANGVFSPSRQHRTPKAVKSEDRQTLKLVSVGSLIRRKGHAHVIETLASLPADSGVTLTIIGEGQDHMGLQNLITKLGLDSRVTLAGDVAPGLIPDILLEHDAFILCSYSEGRSNAILEAMASGIPVIATDIPGTNELIRNNHNGILVPCDSSESLRSAILQLRDNPDMRESLGQSAAQTILDLDLTWERASNDYFGLYNALIKNNIES